MAETKLIRKRSGQSSLFQNIKFLTTQQKCRIDEAIASVGEFGEVRLIVEKGQLRFVVTQTSHDVLKYVEARFVEASKTPSFVFRRCETQTFNF